ncbi:ATP-grasp domain-containing protein [Methanobrevibacter sp. DSM 116169]|uniref:ATP-grasp domain-containing protein n=1 Tax=Methanobrevibacter sp. DSM 116169 TaxID=3242727 RepID=UPI0038FC4022
MRVLFIGSRLFDDVYYYLKEKNVYSILTESNKDAPHLDLANEYHIVSRGMDEPYNIAVSENVDAVVPLIGIDPPLMDVAIFKEKLESEHNIPVIASATSVIDITSDKAKTKSFFNKHSIETPIYKIITKNNLDDSFTYPLVLKQGEGQGGKDIKICHDLDDIKQYLDEFDKAICEEFIEGSEVSVEVIGFNGEYVPLTPIYKGETTLDGVHPLNKIKYGPFESELITNDEIKEIAFKIAKNLSAEAICEIDFIFSPKNSKLYAIEVNSRPNGTRYLTTATCGISTLLKLVDMACGDFSTSKTANEIKNYYSCEIPIGNFNGTRPNEPIKSFKNNTYVVHGPEGYERITLRANSKKDLNNLISSLKLNK